MYTQRVRTVSVTFDPHSTEQHWMDETPGRFEKLDGGAYWGLYRVRQ